MLEAFQSGTPSVADDLVFPGEKSSPISVRALSENYFLPSLERANLRRFRFHDLRHTFGSLLIEAGAPLPYVRDQMGTVLSRSQPSNMFICPRGGMCVSSIDWTH